MKTARQYAEEICEIKDRTERMRKLTLIPESIREEVRMLVEITFKHRKLLRSQSLRRPGNKIGEA